MALREMQRAWEVEHARCEALYAFAPIALVTLDDCGQITDINSCGAALLGAPRQHLMGQLLDAFVGSRDLARWRSHLDRAWMSADAPGFECTLLVRGGGPARVAVTCLPVPPGALPPRLSLALKALTPAWGEAPGAPREAEPQDSLDHLAMVSHELRAPAAAIVGLMELAHRTALTPPQRTYIEAASTAARTLLKLVNQKLDASSLAAGQGQRQAQGQLKLESAPFWLADVLQELMAVIGHQAREKGLAFVLDLAPDVPAGLVGDALRLVQVLINLCVNAIKFTDRGEIALRIQRFAPSAPGQLGLRFEVRDTGMGIADQHLPRLFTPFAQADASIAATHGGTGLGLAICKEIVARMQGEIGVTSQIGVGSSFWFTAVFGAHALAAHPDAGQQNQARHTDVTGTVARQLPGKRALVVEDCTINQFLVTELLTRSAGMSVVIATTGQAAMQCLQAEPFDVVLMDLHLPDMDGWQATAWIRQDPRFHTLPIIALTAELLETDKARCLAAGMNDLVTKPFLVVDLLKVLAACIPDGGGATSAIGVDIAQGLRYCCGNGALLQRIGQRFVRTRAQDGPAIAAALDRGDTAAAAQIAHRQISSASIVGAAGLSGAARALQVAILADMKPRWPELLSVFELHLAAVLCDLNQFLARAELAGAPSKALTPPSQGLTDASPLARTGGRSPNAQA